MLLVVSKFTLGVLLFSALIAESQHKQFPRRSRSDCSVHKGYLIMRRDECKFTIGSFGCRGDCLSSAKPFSHRIGWASSCSCCAPIEARIEEKTVVCRGVKKVIRFSVATKCACRPCLNVT